MNRLAYGPRPGDVERVLEIGVAQWVSLQLQPERIADPVSDLVLEEYELLNASTTDLVTAFEGVRASRRDTSSSARQLRQNRQRLLNRSVAQVSTAKLARAVTSERQLYEVMVDFWHNHFSVFARKSQTRLFLPEYDRDVIRPHAMGRFRDLLGAVAHSPAMLVYLDNWISVADDARATLKPRPTRIAARGLNENYARELMELHTLGVDGGYTQLDVSEVARAFTGWTVRKADGRFWFRSSVHDAEAKNVLGRRMPPGRGMEDGNEVLDMLARHPATARHISRKLAVRFVSDTPPADLVDRCARVFASRDGDIRATLRCVIGSPEFFSEASYRAKVKTPFELVASAFRASGTTLDGSTRSLRILAQLGQPVFGRETPDGWPDTADEWMNPGAIMTRVNFALDLSRGRLPGVRTSSMDGKLAAALRSPEFQLR